MWPQREQIKNQKPPNTTLLDSAREGDCQVAPILSTPLPEYHKQKETCRHNGYLELAQLMQAQRVPRVSAVGFLGEQ